VARALSERTTDPSTVAARRTQNAAVGFALGLVLESGPLAIAAVVGRPFGLAFAGLGFVLAWAAIGGARRTDGTLDAVRGLRSLRPSLGRLAAFCGIATACTTAFVVATAFLVGLWFRDLLAGAFVVALTLTLLARFAFVVPCLVDGDELIVAFERSWLLVGAGGVRGVCTILGLGALALGPPIVVVELGGPSAPATVAATVLVLAATGPILVLGLERARPAFEAAARRIDPAYRHA
jgi:hypothetical protein